MSNNTEMENYFFRASAEDFKKIPGGPVAYWVSKNIFNIFKSASELSKYCSIGKGLDTGDNNRFLRLWFEVERNEKWVPCQKGGPFRRWYGNNEYVINWENNGDELKNFKGSNLRNAHNYFKAGLSWTRVSSSNTAFRFFPKGQIFESTGPCLFADDELLLKFSAFLNSKVSEAFLKFIAPTLDFQSGHISKLPILDAVLQLQVSDTARKSTDEMKVDWDSYETSWDFTALPLLANDLRQSTLADTYVHLRQHWLNTTLEMQRLEEENNRIFIDAYGLQEELTPDVPLKEITLTCNPYYRYGKEAEQQGKDYPLDAKLEERLRLDTMAEFISYAVGCMFGRYSLDKEGLVLANQGESLADYLAQVPNPSFEIDDDNVIPILDADWFADDIVERFRKFLRVTFGDAHFRDNLAFIEKALGKDVRSYFLKDFYNDHVQRYKKRPIYWMFSSPKGSFNALIYMHRYRPDTVSVVLNDYLREFRTKLEAQIKYQEAVEASSSASPSDKTKALKEIDRLKKVLIELDDYERDTLYPLATQQLTIDLDDGVKVNYPKFGNALKKIVGL